MPSPYSLVWHNGALGDGIVAQPAVRAFIQSREHPVYALGRSPALPILVDRGALAGMKSLSLSEQLQIFSPGAPLPKLLEESERVLTFSGPDGVQARIRELLGERLIELRQPPCYRFGEAPSDAQAVSESLLAQLPFPKARMAWKTPALERRHPALPGLVIHPGAGGQGKTWPAERWLELARSLRNSGLDLKFVLGPVELERGWPIDKARELGLAVSTPETIAELAEEIESRRIFVGQDSGPSHLAAALGSRVFVLFGDSAASVWAPASATNKVSILQAPGGRIGELAIPVVEDFLFSELETATFQG